MTGDGRGTADMGSRELVASAREVAAAAWRAAPVLLVCYVLVMIAEAAAPVALAWLTKLIVDGLTDELAGARASVGLAGVAVALAGVGVVAALLAPSARYLSSEIGRRFVVYTTDRLFSAAARLPGLRPFEDPHFLDRLRLAQQGTSMGGTTVAEAFTTGRAVLTVAGFVSSLLVISPLMTAVVVGSAAPALVAHLRLSRRRASMAWKLSPADRWHFFYSDLLGSVDAAKEIRLFGSGGFLRGRMMGHLHTATAARRRMDQRELSTEGALALLSAVVAGGGLMWAIGAARAGTLSPGDITMLIAAVASVQGALAALVSSIAGAHHGLLLLGHYRAVVRSQPDLAIAAHPRPLPPLRRGIQLRDVWFRYSDDHPWVLRGVNLVIPAGQAVALVGLNGAGKSTLVKLLCRFYDPSRGTIHWDGVDLREVPPEDLRARISGVFQDHVAYHLSAEDNVAIGDVAAYGDLDRVRAAARQAGMDETLAALPRGYQTLLTRMFLSEDDKQDPATGVVLSGGQWQRMALARAYFRAGRDLMILDEPSAGLDPEAEAELHARIRRSRAGRTSLLISHRLNTVRDADLVVVLQDGAVVEQGGHDALMLAGGAYARLFRLQAAGYQVDKRPAALQPVTHGDRERR
jgi:ATP-binding cassette subfamily B protein